MEELGVRADLAKVLLVVIMAIIIILSVTMV